MTLLRYFNPVGAHESGTSGEDPQGIPNNLMPFLTQVAIGRRDCPRSLVTITQPSTAPGARLHPVMDLAEGHVKALEHQRRTGRCHAYNLGTGQGQSVLQMVAAFEAACGRPLPTGSSHGAPATSPSAGPIPPRPGTGLARQPGSRRHVRRQLALAVRQPHGYEA